MRTIKAGGKNAARRNVIERARDLVALEYGSQDFDAALDMLAEALDTLEQT